MSMVLGAALTQQAPCDTETCRCEAVASAYKGTEGESFLLSLLPDRLLTIECRWTEVSTATGVIAQRASHNQSNSILPGCRVGFEQWFVTL